MTNRSQEEPSIYTPPSGPPQGEGPNPALFAAMGRDAIFKMCSDFYSRLEQSAIRPMFSPDMEKASRRFAAFMVSALGGPPLYRTLYGPPKMRARHLPFAIDETARRIWLECFYETLQNAEAYGIPAEDLPGLIQYLDDFSAWMVNRE